MQSVIQSNFNCAIKSLSYSMNWQKPSIVLTPDSSHCLDTQEAQQRIRNTVTILDDTFLTTTFRDGLILEVR